MSQRFRLYFYYENCGKGINGFADFNITQNDFDEPNKYVWKIGIGFTEIFETFVLSVIRASVSSKSQDQLN